MKTQTRTIDQLRDIALRTFLFALALFVLTEVVTAQSVVRVQKTVEVTHLGDGQIEQDVILPLQQYHLLKGSSNNMAVLLRELGHGRHWYRFDEMNGQYDDMKNRVNFSYIRRGMARPVKGDRWVIVLDQYDDLELVAQIDRTLLLSSLSTMDGMPCAVTHRMNFPPGVSDIRLNASKHEVSYRFQPEQEVAGDREEVSFEVDYKKQILSVLGKVYSNPKFNFMWAARSTFQNTGDVAVSDYRVRFRVGDLGPWSGWNRTETVYPGQIVIDPFFPVLDLAKLLEMNGTRPSQIEVEYQYRGADGQIVKESDAFSTQVLARNQAIFSSLDADQCLTFNDRFNYVPAIIGSMVTPNDPVMQQIVGRVHGKAARSTGGAIAASDNTEDAIKLLAAMWSFMQENNITYQTPPAMLVDGHSGQHIKYGRDVIVNRAGTCIDLAIMWATVCEASGLNPIVLVIPGHAFPAVELPNGNVLAWESTLVDGSFEQAVKVGMENYRKLDPETTFQINLRDVRAFGFQSNELPKVDTDYVDQMGLTFTAPQQVNEQPPQTETQVTRTNQRETEQTPERTNNVPQMPAAAVGRWEFRGNVNGVQVMIRIEIAQDSSYYGYAYFGANGQEAEVEEVGVCKVEGNSIVFLSSDEELSQHKVNFNTGEMEVVVEDLNHSFLLQKQ